MIRIFCSASFHDSCSILNIRYGDKAAAEEMVHSVKFSEGKVRTFCSSFQSSLISLVVTESQYVYQMLLQFLFPVNRKFVQYKETVKYS